MKVYYFKYLLIISTFFFSLSFVFGGVPIGGSPPGPIDATEFQLVSLCLAFVFISYFFYKLFYSNKKISNN